MTTAAPRIDFSFKREVFFVVVGALSGAITMIIPKTIFEVEMGLPYYISWVTFGHIVGVYSPASVIIGIGIHILTAISIGIVIGIFLYKSNILNISKISNGLLYGTISGFAVFVIFFIPVQQFILGPEIARTLTEMDPAVSEISASGEIANNLVSIMIGSVIMHQVFGITLGLVSSSLSVRFGARYRCSLCDISFSRIDSLQKHLESIHGAKPVKQIHILILGGGFAGIQVLKELQAHFQNDIEIDITLVSKENFFLFTPMLPEVSSGMIETRHILTPIRTFCKRAKFYEATVSSIDLSKKQIGIVHSIGREDYPLSQATHTLNCEYLVIALGSETNFFGLKDVAENTFTIKSIGDAIVLRNHIINMLEQADIEHKNQELRGNLMTFVVVGGGFSGVETVGELNDFVRDSIRHYYHNIDEKDVKVILISATGKILPEVTDDLSEFALKKLRENEIEVVLNARVEGATFDSVSLKDGRIIRTHTLVWAGGVIPPLLISDLPCRHDKTGRILADKSLQISDYSDVYVLGDCASVTDPSTGKPYPPTAQHAVKQAKIVSYNIISSIKGNRSKKRQFDYKTRGVMALIGRKNGVGILLGYKVYGFIAWWLWRSYYLANIPTTEKKIRVMVDWFVDLFFNRDVTRLKMFPDERISKQGKSEKAY
ncbi:MAG: NAD(P)/FAD-dependent oxidoreductase [Nitrososphaeraceae archaeon]